MALDQNLSRAPHFMIDWKNYRQGVLSGSILGKCFPLLRG